MCFVNPFQPRVTFHIETSLLIYTANQMASFYMKCNTGMKRFNLIRGNSSQSCPLLGRGKIRCPDEEKHNYLPIVGSHTKRLREGNHSKLGDSVLIVDFGFGIIYLVRTQNFPKNTSY